jgi:UDP-N-acetyl-2-amino-2-deoxyglucuronate dehydrogenase
MSKKHTISLCGCGHIAQKHLAAIADNPGLSLQAIVDTQAAVRENMSATLGVPAFESLEALHAAFPQLDLIALCTPSGLHAEQTVWAANQGWNIVTEKPLATTLAGGKAMLEACEANQVNLYMVHQLRYNPIMQEVKKAVAEGRFGQIYVVTAEVMWNRPQSYFDSVSWRGSKVMDGGAYLNQACHFIDLMYWLFGEVKQVQAMMRTLGRKIEAEDSGVINLQFANHILGSIAVTLLAYPKNLRGSLTILGEKGSVVIDGPCLNHASTWEFEESRPIDETIKHLNHNDYLPGHHLFYQQVVASMNGDKDAAIKGNEGYKTLDIIMAAHRASEEQKDVLL